MIPAWPVGGRPYEPTGMTTDKWRQIPPQTIRLADLHLGQDTVDIHGLIRHVSGGDTSYSGDTHPHVVRYRGRLYLSDGHHRAVIALIRGDESFLARVLDSAK